MRSDDLDALLWVGLGVQTTELIGEVVFTYSGGSIYEYDCGLHVWALYVS